MADETEGEELAPKKSKTMIIVIVVVAVNLGIVGVVLAVTLGSGGSAPPNQAGANRPGAGQSAEPGPIVKLNNFVVNVDSDEGRVYLKATIVVELGNDQDMSFFEKSQMLVRNEVLMYLSSLDAQGTRTVKQKKGIQSRLKTLINKRLGAEIITGVYFTEFVTQ